MVTGFWYRRPIPGIHVTYGGEDEKWRLWEVKREDRKRKLGSGSTAPIATLLRRNIWKRRTGFTLLVVRRGPTGLSPFVSLYLPFMRKCIVGLLYWSTVCLIVQTIAGICVSLKEWPGFDSVRTLHKHQLLILSRSTDHWSIKPRHSEIWNVGVFTSTFNLRL